MVLGQEGEEEVVEEEAGGRGQDWGMVVTVTMVLQEEEEEEGMTRSQPRFGSLTTWWDSSLAKAGKTSSGCSHRLGPMYKLGKNLICNLVRPSVLSSFVAPRKQWTNAVG